MNKFLQTYLTIVATFIMLFMAAILIAVIYVGVKVSEQVVAVQKKADDLSTQVDSFTRSINKLDASVKVINLLN